MAASMLFATGPELGAQDGSFFLATPERPPANPGASGPAQVDFLFGPPRISLSFRGGLHIPRAESDVFDFLTEELTLAPRDLRGFAFEAELGVRLGERLEGVLAVGHSKASEHSEFLHWEGEDGLPIEQVTRLRTTPLTVGLKVYPQPRGRSVGRFVWIPASFAPFLGAGAGLIEYRLEQEGEFVDFRDLEIFRERFTSADWGGTFHLMGGADLRLTRRMLLTGEARYRWASGELGGDFVGFEPIDLSGLQATAGLTFRF